MTRLEEAWAEIARRREVAAAATPGPWSATRMGLRGGMVGVVVSSMVTKRFVLADRDREVRLEDGQHAADNNPAHVLAVLDAADAALGRHAQGRIFLPDPYGPNDLAVDGCVGCLWRHWPCPDAAAVLDLYAPAGPR